jgi:hypothetical protein
MPCRIASINFFFEDTQVDVVHIYVSLVEIQLIRIHLGSIVMKRAHIQEHALTLWYIHGLCSGRCRSFFWRPFSLLYDVVYTHMTDQIAFNEVLSKTKLFTCIHPLNNWMCNLGTPNLIDGVFFDPFNYKSKINVLHLSGKNKLKRYSKMLFNNGKYLEDIKGMINNEGYYV